MRAWQEHRGRNGPALQGRVATGLGKGAGFTRLDWARSQFIEHCGIDPHPGTLNIIVETEAHRSSWHDLTGSPPSVVRPPEPGGCDAELFPVTVHAASGAGANSVSSDPGRAVPAAVVRPAVRDYPDDQVEIIAAVDLRAYFGVADGDVLAIELQRPRTFTAMIFDVDGTLLNSLDAYRIAASRATAPYGYEVSDETVCRALDGNIPFWDIVLPPDGASDEQLIERLRAETLRHFPAALAEVVSVLPGTRATLDRLRDAGIRLALFTGSGGESFPPLRDAGLLEYFEVIVTGKEVARRKPHPEGILRCLDALGVAPGEAAYVGDSCVDVGASHAARVTPFAVLTGAGSSASLSMAGAHRVLTSVSALPELLNLGPGGR